MAKKILVIVSSPRKNGNSTELARRFCEGARESGNDVEIEELRGKEIKFCTGCLACQKTGACVLRDDACSITEKMRSADVVVFATPVYFYGMSGQMKTLLDRTNPIFSSEYKFREIYLLASAADTSAGAIDGTSEGVKGWLSCFDRARLKGVLFAAGALNPGDVSAKKLNEAREMGRKA